MPRQIPWQYNNPATWEYHRNISFFAQPLNSNSEYLQASIQNSNSDAYSIARQPAFSVSGVLKNDIVYKDKPNVKVSFVLKDFKGCSPVLLDDFTVKIIVTTDDASSERNVPITNNIIHDYSLEIPSNWWPPSSMAEVSIKVFSSSSLVVAKSKIGNVTIAPTPIHTDLNEPGLIAQLPLSPRFRYDVFKMPIRAHTNPDKGWELALWRINIEWNDLVLEYVSFQYNNELYDIMNTLINTNVLSITARKKNNAVVSGTDVLLVKEVVFRVRTDAHDDMTHDVINVTAVQLLNQYTFLFVQDEPAYIHDMRDGKHTTGQLTVERDVVVGHLTQTSSTDMVNTGSHRKSIHHINVFEIHSQEEKTDVSSSSVVKVPIRPYWRATMHTNSAVWF